MDSLCVCQGFMILRIMSSVFPESVPVVHFNMFWTPPAPGADMSMFTEVEKRLIAAKEESAKNGFGYFVIQSTKASLRSSLK